MSYEVLAIVVIPVVGTILITAFGEAVRHFMIDAPSVRRPD